MENLTLNWCVETYAVYRKVTIPLSTVFLPSEVKFAAVVCLLLHCCLSRYNCPLVPPVPLGDYHDGQTRPSRSEKLCNASYVIFVNIFFLVHKL